MTRDTPHISAYETSEAKLQRAHAGNPEQMRNDQAVLPTASWSIAYNRPCCSLSVKKSQALFNKGYVDFPHVLKCHMPNRCGRQHWQYGHLLQHSTCKDQGTRARTSQDELRICWSLKGLQVLLSGTSPVLNTRSWSPPSSHYLARNRESLHGPQAIVDIHLEEGAWCLLPISSATQEMVYKTAGK